MVVVTEWLQAAEFDVQAAGSVVTSPKGRMKMDPGLLSDLDTVVSALERVMEMYNAVRSSEGPSFYDH